MVVKKGFHPDRIRWILARDPLLIGIGTEPAPVRMLDRSETRPTTSLIEKTIWTSFVREQDTGRTVEAVLHCDPKVLLDRRGTDAAGRPTPPRTAKLYRLKEGMTLGALADMLDAYGIAFLQPASKQVTDVKAVLDRKRL